jgi:27-O-demethylrifamycin SV methyltransferase
MKAAEHYNRVTDSWKEFMGDNLHFGYFETPNAPLKRATDALIERMAGLCRIARESRVLDVGCGVGGPALYLHEQRGCAIDGISTSVRGVELANGASEARGHGRYVRFRVADGCDNGFPPASFDVAWVMESSHLMHDKKSLFRECRRVLKPGGALVLCDIMLLDVLPRGRELLRYAARAADYLRLLRAFGNARVNSPGAYCNGLVGAGFRNVTVIDSTAETLPTLTLWKMNASVHAGGIGGFSPTDVRRFMAACDSLEDFFTKGIFGYCMVRAEK